MDVHLRAPLAADEEGLWALDQRCFPRGVAYSRDEMHAYIRVPRAFHRVAENAAGELVGFILTHSGRQRGHVITLDVAPEWRRQRIGDQLMAAAETHYRENGAIGMSLEVAVNNPTAMKFYTRRGYRLARILPGYYATGIDGLRLRLDFNVPSR